MLGLTVLQLLPMPPALINVVSPHAREVWTRLVLDVPLAVPISVDLDAGFWALLVIAATVSTFACARSIFARGGVGTSPAPRSRRSDSCCRCSRSHRTRRRAESVLALDPAAGRSAPVRPIRQPQRLRHLVGDGDPCRARLSCGARHRAPAPVPAARAVADAPARDGRQPRHLAVRFAVLAMIVALTVSMSRSAMFGLAVAVVTAALFRPSTGTLGRVKPLWVGSALALVVVAVLMYVSPQALAGRISQARVSAAGRWIIWKETVPIIRDFWLTGTGAGTYETVMLVYQRTMPGVRFNTAHNHYLQFAAEGGLLLTIPFVLALRRLWRDAEEMVTTDDSAILDFLRAGAICGLAGRRPRASGIPDSPRPRTRTSPPS